MHSNNKNIIVGYTGFVGQTLCDDIHFDYHFNSKNLYEIVKCPEGCNLYLSCLPATKWMVNKNVAADIENIFSIIEYLKQNKYSKVYLMSTIDVYGDSPTGVSETYAPNYSGLNYGSNRLMFESLVKNYLEYEEYRVFRLPALFGKNLKKNIIFDLMNDNQVEKINTNSYFQWYDLSELSKHICEFSYNHPEVEVFNLFPEPVSTIEILDTFFPDKRCSSGNLINYNYRTEYSETGYIYSKEDTLAKLSKFLSL